MFQCIWFMYEELQNKDLEQSQSLPVRGVSRQPTQPTNPISLSLLDQYKPAAHGFRNQHIGQNFAPCMQACSLDVVEKITPITIFIEAMVTIADF